LIPDRSGHLFGHPRRQPHRRLGHLAPIDAGRHPDPVGEAAAEAAQQGTADRETYLDDTQVAPAQQRHGPLDTSGHPHRCWAPRVWWAPGRLLPWSSGSSSRISPPDGRSIREHRRTGRGPMARVSAPRRPGGAGRGDRRSTGRSGPLAAKWWPRAGPRPGWPSPPGWLGWRSALPAQAVKCSVFGGLTTRNPANKVVLPGSSCPGWEGHGPAHRPVDSKQRPTAPPHPPGGCPVAAAAAAHRGGPASNTGPAAGSGCGRRSWPCWSWPP
jgi:hypothetical protein